MSDCSNWRGDRIKAAVERQFRERRSEDSGARAVREKQSERIQRVIAETNERVDVSGWRRVRTCVSLSVLNKNTWVFTSQPCPLPSFLRTLLQYLIDRIGGGAFTGWDKTSNKHTSEGNKPNESPSGQDKVICRSKVQSLSSLTHWSCHYNRDKGTAVELKWSGSDLKHLNFLIHFLSKKISKLNI